MPLLEVRRVRSGYGPGPDILTGVDLEVEAGGAYCIIGPNGAGKSTLLKTIAGLVRPRSGEISFDGEQIGGLRPDRILSLGVCFVPQDRTLFPEMSVKENLRMGAFLERDRQRVSSRMREVLELFPILAERTGQLAQTMSGGEQQMLAMARALMTHPKMLMIDEPSLGLAPQVTNQIFGLIRRLRKELGITIVLVEQNVRRGLEVTDWSFVMDLGATRFSGPSDEIADDSRIRDLYLGTLAKGNADG